MKPKVEIALLSHRVGNIGHTFMSLGFEEILDQKYKGQVAIQHFEQHKFFSIYKQPNLASLTDFVPHGKLKRLRMWLSEDEQCFGMWARCEHLRKFTAAITCGGPSIVRGVSAIPEMKLMFHHQLGAFHYHGVKTLDCAVGSGGFGLSERFENINNVFSSSDKEYFRKLFCYSDVSTVRDKFAQELWESLGRTCPLIPCAAIVSGRRFESLATANPSKNYIIINYQLTGANSDWGQGVDVTAWQDVTKELVMRLRSRHEVVFLCHNKHEQRHARRLGLNLPIYLPKNLKEYAEIIVNAKAAVASRIHAAIPIAGVGVPVVAVGTDTRLGTLELMGIPSFFAKSVSAELLEIQVEDMLMRANKERERLHSVREDTADRYSQLFSEVF